MLRHLINHGGIGKKDTNSLKINKPWLLPKLSFGRKKSCTLELRVRFTMHANKQKCTFSACFMSPVFTVRTFRPLLTRFRVFVGIHAHYTEAIIFIARRQGGSSFLSRLSSWHLLWFCFCRLTAVFLGIDE